MPDPVVADDTTPPGAAPFWERKTLAEMSREEWEAVCDGCAKCCLSKLRDWDSDEVAYTNVACRLLDLHTCRCKDYAHRRRHVRNCENLTPARVLSLDWLPSTCAYRLLAEGKSLPWWHHLISGDRELVHRVGASVRGRVVAEREAGPLDHHIVDWPR